MALIKNDFFYLMQRALNNDLIPEEVETLKAEMWEANTHLAELQKKKSCVPDIFSG